jgi:hypothetical protein
MMQLAAAIAVTVCYGGLTLAWGGVHPGNGAPRLGCCPAGRLDGLVVFF